MKVQGALIAWLIEGMTTLFSYDDDCNAAEEIAALLRQAKLDVEIAKKEDIEKVIWSKLLVNAVVNPLGTGLHFFLIIRLYS